MLYYCYGCVEESENVHKMSLNASFTLPSISIINPTKRVVLEGQKGAEVRPASKWIRFVLPAKMGVSKPFPCDSLCGKWQLILLQWKTISINEAIIPTSGI